MNKKLIFITLISVFSKLSLAKIEIQTSYPMAVITAAYTWAGVGSNSKALEEILTKEFQGQEELKKSIKTQLENLPKSCSGKDERNDCHNSREIIVQLALESRDLNELSKKMINVWSLKLVSGVISPIKTFAVKYEKKIWNKNEKAFRQQIELMRNLSDKLKADDFLNDMKIFYVSNWPNWLPNVVGVYPVPAKRGHTSGSSYGHFAEQAILLNSKEAANVLAVSFHEMAHGYYHFQDKNTQSQWAEILAKFSMRDRFILQSLLNEGFATIIGNGIAYEMMTGSTDASPWYTDPFIEAFARSNYDLIKKKFLDKTPLTLEDFSLMISNFKKSSTDWEINPQFYSKTFAAYFSPTHASNEVISFMRSKHMANSVYRFDKYEPMLKTKYDELATFYVFLKPGENIPSQIASFLPQKILSKNKRGLEMMKDKDRWITVVWFNDLNDLKAIFP